MPSYFPATSIRCHFTIVSGEKIASTWRSTSSPSFVAAVARRRFCDTSRMIRLWPSFFPQNAVLHLGKLDYLLLLTVHPARQRHHDELPWCHGHRTGHVSSGPSSGKRRLGIAGRAILGWLTFRRTLGNRSMIMTKKPPFGILIERRNCVNVLRSFGVARRRKFARLRVS